MIFGHYDFKSGKLFVLLQDPLKEIKRIDQHIGSNADAELLDDIVSATSFTSLRKTKHSSEQHLDIVFQGSMYRKGVRLKAWTHSV